MIFSTGLRHPEGPVALEDGSWLVVEAGAGRGCVTQISPDGSSRRTLARTGRPNGLAVDKYGFVWVAESERPSLLRVSMDGRIEVARTECNGEPFLFPNDLCFGPDGALYLTDSGVLIHQWAPDSRIRDDYMMAPIDGRVYRIEINTKRITMLDRGLRFANGIAFGPDEALYVNESVTGMVYRYEWRNGVITGPRQPFANVNDPSVSGYKGPDGMAFSSDGKLYVTVYGQRDVTVLSPSGEIIERIPTAGRNPSNVAFALPGRRGIFVTECEMGQIEWFDVAIDGLPLWLGSQAGIAEV